ncbi:mandelate racemase/muconate lactonizing enzyme family protein [Rhizobium leguminosarum]|uniref:mandelate racemase/muconate lactonizing enzyme family protein n=1 Tax=Rhizobium leguminosarum TaxID=384 RepID=UPI001C9459C1|nr:mandelate racemase/muconate lactonizing enzyme family protein [Rhizobium leguminosarum]MBY5406766.1 mandelate racemase/muconate lactonizing enzyme family protein [Rhizobium leguminosarum]
MKITAVKATPVTVELIRPSASAMSCSNVITRTIVEIETDAGISGLGETGGADVAAIITEKFAPQLLGRDPRERMSLRRLCLPHYRDYGMPRYPLEMSSYAGVEIALWDILGKSVDLPLYRVLGGAVRPRAPFSSYAFTLDVAGTDERDVPLKMAELAVQQVTEMGASMFEFKVARHSVDCDIETVREIRRALGPDIEIAVDANMRYSVDQARRFLRAVGSELANIEEPTSSLAECSRLRADFGVPVSTHCADFDTLQQHPLLDNVVGALDQQGGIARTMELAGIAAALGRRYWLRSCLELGVAWAAMTHLGMACLHLDRPAQGLIHWVKDDLIKGGPWLIREGGVAAPELPGLGVALDKEAFAIAAERFERRS